MTRREGARRSTAAIAVTLASACDVPTLVHLMREHDAAIALYRRFGFASRTDRRAVLACRLGAQ